MLMQFERLQNVITQGIESGEFKNVNPQAAAATLMGSISFCLHMAQSGMSLPPDAFLDCIFNGLLA